MFCAIINDETALPVRVFFILWAEVILRQLVDDLSYYSPIIWVFHRYRYLIGIPIDKQDGLSIPQQKVGLAFLHGGGAPYLSKVDNLVNNWGFWYFYKVVPPSCKLVYKP